MAIAISDPDRKRFIEISKLIDGFGYNESVFIKNEILFYEAISIAKNYGSDLHENVLLAELKKVYSESYEKTRGLFKKRSQREACIRQFLAQFKRVISGKCCAFA